MAAIGFLIVVALILYGIVLIGNIAAFASANVLVAFDKVLGGWPTADPLWSWVLNGLVCGSLLYLACEEGPHLRDPRVRGWALAAVVAWLVAAWFVGPKI